MTERETRGQRRRRKGIPMEALKASALDPRTSYLGYLTESEKDELWLIIEDDCQEITVVTPSNLTKTTAMPSFLRLGPQNIAATSDSKEKIIHDEIAKFRAHHKVSMNPLDWWRQQADIFPHLAVLVKKWLAIPASSASSERTFSSAGFIGNKFRSRLLSSRIDELVFLHKNGILFDSFVEEEDSKTVITEDSKKRARKASEETNFEERLETEEDQNEENELEEEKQDAINIELTPQADLEDLFEDLVLLDDLFKEDEGLHIHQQAAVDFLDGI